MAVTYFGQCDSSGNPTSNDGYDSLGASSYAGNKTATYTCPGSGVQNVTTLGVYGKRSSATAGVIRCAVYDTSRNLIFQWDAGINPTNDVVDWLYKDAANLSGTTTLTGGTNYLFMITGNASPLQVSYTTGSSGDWAYTSGTEYTAGFPATITAPGTNFALKYICRCGVEPAATINAPLIAPRLLNNHYLIGGRLVC